MKKVNITPHEKSKYKNCYVLGDSLSDSGALIGILNGILKVAKEELHCLWIDKIDFSLPCYDARSFSNGPMAVEYVANKLGTSPMKPGWNFHATPALKHWIIEQHAIKFLIQLSDFLQNKGVSALSYTLSEQVGTNYAVSNARASFGYSLPYFLLFNQFQLKNQLNSLIKHHPDLAEDDLIVIMIGGNDVMAAISEKQPSTIIDDSISEIHNSLKILVAKNVRQVIVANVPDIGLIPEFVNTDKQQTASRLTASFNQKLKHAIEEFKNSYPEMVIKLFSLDTVLKNLIIDYKKKGYNTEQACISDIADHKDLITLLELLFTGKLRTIYNRGCSDIKINDYLFFDYFHPTKLPHQITADSLYDLIIKEGEVNSSERQ